MSKLIVVEGPDRVGKNTQCHLLKETFARYGMLAIVIEVPIKSALTYRIIYWMLQNGFAKKFPKIFQWFQYLNRRIFQESKLPILEGRYDVIIMDRWSLSTIVYGIAEGVSKKFTMSLADKLRRPDYTIILHGHAHEHTIEDVYEADKDLQKKVRLEYVRWAINNLDSSTLIDCQQSKMTVAKKIKEALQNSKILPRY